MRAAITIAVNGTIYSKLLTADIRYIIHPCVVNANTVHAPVIDSRPSNNSHVSAKCMRIFNIDIADDTPTVISTVLTVTHDDNSDGPHLNGGKCVKTPISDDCSSSVMVVMK